MEQIRVTPEELMSTANDLSRVAEDLNTQVNTLSSTIQSMTSTWKGMGSNAYYNHYVQMEPDIRGFAALIETIASMAKGAAQSFDATDSDVAQSFS